MGIGAKLNHSRSKLLRNGAKLNLPGINADAQGHQFCTGWEQVERGTDDPFSSLIAEMSLIGEMLRTPDAEEDARRA